MIKTSGHRREVRNLGIGKAVTAVVAAGLAMAAGGAISAPAAHADGYMTAYEYVVADESWYATCYVFDDMFTGRVHADTAVALGVTQAISERYALDPDDAIDVINYSVRGRCPRHWDNLVAIGENARGGPGLEAA